jgi:cyclic-di-AMP phosphodiesterase PgpH
MAKEETKGLRKKNGRQRARRRKELEHDEDSKVSSSGLRGIWLNGGKQSLLTLAFAVAVIFICFVGQDPPGLRTLGENAPESVYSHRDFRYLSEIRRANAEEWIRSSTPREFARNFAGEERFAKAVIRLEDGLLANNAMVDLETAVIAQANLIQELQAKFQLTVTEEEMDMLVHWRDFPKGENYFEFLAKILGQLHLTGVVKFPSSDQKFRSEENATDMIDGMMKDLADRLVVITGLNDGLDFNLNPDSLSQEYSELARNLTELEEHLENDGPFPEEALVLKDLIESSDENASIAAERFRDNMVSVFSGFARKGLFLRTIDKAETTAAQDRAIKLMEQPIVFVKKDDLILEKGKKVGELDLEKYEEYLKQTVDDRNLLPKRVFVTFGTFLFAVVYISLVLPNFWRDNARSIIVAVAILVNLGLSRIILELGSTNLFGGNALLIGLLPYLIPIAFAPMVVMLTVGPRMAALAALMTSVFHATMQNAGIDALSVSLSSALVGAYFCRDVRLRGSVLKAGAMAGLTGAILALGIGFATGSGWVASANHAFASLLVGAFTGGLVLGAMPLIENSFKVATDATLFELTDFNHPLLRRMQVEAPGTYHHSLMVANLAENAAVAVKANPILCRACSLFHDIGKMSQPDYFTENQGGFDNPHAKKNPAMSALIIKSHVKEGIEMAREHRLPKVIRDVIRQHHGTTLVKYFYHQAKQQLKQEKLHYGDLEEEPDESTYRYDGPRPRFKESAIIFFADSVEAAARSLPKVTHHSVEELLESIFQDRLEDGQLDECPLTLEEMSKIKDSFLKTSLNMLHSRIEYPDDEKGKGRRGSTPPSGGKRG